MKQLIDYIADAQPKRPLWDGHTHLLQNVPPTAHRRVIMPFNPMNGDTNVAITSVNRLPKNMGEDENLWLGTANDPRELKVVLAEDRFAGIGELTVRKTFKRTEYTRQFMESVWQPWLLNGLSAEQRPVYIHFDLDGPDGSETEDLQDGVLIKFLKEHSGPVVLCHCGLNREVSEDMASRWSKFLTLKDAYPNLWGDISWDCLDWIYGDLNRLPASLDRFIAGSDLTPFDGDDQCGKRAQQLLYLEKYTHGQLSYNVDKLFGISETV